jgi:hypothetical protein
LEFGTHKGTYSIESTLLSLGKEREKTRHLELLEVGLGRMVGSLRVFLSLEGKRLSTPSNPTSHAELARIRVATLLPFKGNN